MGVVGRERAEIQHAWGTVSELDRPARERAPRQGQPRFSLTGGSRWPTSFEDAAGSSDCDGEQPRGRDSRLDAVSDLLHRTLMTVRESALPTLHPGDAIGVRAGRDVIVQRVLATAASCEEALEAASAGCLKGRRPVVVVRLLSSGASPGALCSWAAVDVALGEGDGQRHGKHIARVRVTHVVFGDVTVVAPGVPGFDPWLFLRD